MEMSRFAKKAFAGELPTESDWEEHLKEAHSNTSEMTSTVFAGRKDSSGQDSYEKLIDACASLDKRPLRILDLGCGDGYLLRRLYAALEGKVRLSGCDISPDEIDRAKNHLTRHDIAAELLRTRAQELPHGQQSVDAVLSHMTFMLMSPLKPVADKIGAILSPGGLFAAVVPHRSEASGLYNELTTAINHFLDSRFKNQKIFNIGDPRSTSLGGWSQLFPSSAGFSEPEIRPFFPTFPANPESVWAFYKDMYFIAMLNDEDKNSLRKRLEHLVEISPYAEILVPLALISIHKSGA